VPQFHIEETHGWRRGDIYGASPTPAANAWGLPTPGAMNRAATPAPGGPNLSGKEREITAVLLLKPEGVKNPSEIAADVKDTV